MTRLLTVAVFLLCTATTPTLADGIEVLFDFEDQDWGLIDPLGGLELTDATTGLRVKFDRVSNLDPTNPALALPLEIVDVGEPSFGTRSLSPFLDTRANEFVGYLRITIDTSALFDPTLQVGRIDWDMGDYLPSDNDDLYIASDTETLGTLDGFVEYDNPTDFPPFFAWQTYTLIRADNITQVRMFGGTGQVLDAPNSVFYDNFLFSLVAPGTYSLDDETPISSFTGGGLIDELGPQVGSNGGTPIPEPGTILGVAIGLAVLGWRVRRRSD